MDANEMVTSVFVLVEWLFCKGETDKYIFLEYFSRGIHPKKPKTFIKYIHKYLQTFAFGEEGIPAESTLYIFISHETY